MRQCCCIRLVVILLMQEIITSKSDSTEELCRSILPDDYRFFETPNGEKPVKIYNRFDVMNIGEIDEEKMDYLLHVFITFIWKDSRIKIIEAEGYSTNPTILPSKCLEQIWQPDIFFETAKTVDIFKSTTPTIVLKVYGGGKISLTVRYLFRSSCQMQFENYPFDSQLCEFLVSLISPDSEAILCWTDDEDQPVSNRPVINIVRQINPLQYSLGNVRTHKIFDVLPDANYTTLVADFVFHRRLIGSVINTYIPSTLIVLMSWFGFWLGVEAVPARVALSITSLLTLCTQAQQYQSQLPPVNYIKAMDIWLFVCIFFVFSTLLEFAVAYNIQQKKTQLQINKQGKLGIKGEFGDLQASQMNNSDKLAPAPRLMLHDTIRTFYLKLKLELLCPHLWAKVSKQSVDEISKKIYPGLFIVFASSYWIHYLRIYYGHI